MVPNSHKNPVGIEFIGLLERQPTPYDGLVPIDSLLIDRVLTSVTERYKIVLIVFSELQKFEGLWEKIGIVKSIDNSIDKTIMNINCYDSHESMASKLLGRRQGKDEDEDEDGDEEEEIEVDDDQIRVLNDLCAMLNRS